MKYFIEAQGYSVKHNVLQQDNNFTILLATNGWWSSSKRMKYIKSCYFLVKDKVESKEVEIGCAPTKTMWADELIKLKQGRELWIFHANLINNDKNYNDEVEKLTMHPDFLPKAE